MRNVLLLITTVLTACSADLTTEEEVINATFMDMVGTSYFNEPPPPPPARPIHPHSIHYEIAGEIELTIELDGEVYEPKDSLTLAKEWELERERMLRAFNNFDWDQYEQDSINWLKNLDNPNREKRNTILLVYDSLTVPQVDLFDLSFKLSNNGFQENLQLDDSWGPLTKKLFESDLISKYLPIERLTKIGDYQLRPVHFEPSAKDRVVATLTFSRVVFIEDRTKACYYYKENCGLLCAYGYMVYTERKEGTWRLKAKRLLWIS